VTTLFFIGQIVEQPDSPLPDRARDAVIARIARLAVPVRRDLEDLSCTPAAVDGPLLAALGVGTESVAALVATGLDSGRPTGRYTCRDRDLSWQSVRCAARDRWRMIRATGPPERDPNYC
jgi:hypothetical protein